MLLALADLRAIIDNMPVPVWLSDAEGRLGHVNSRWLEFTGRAMEEELGDGWAEGIHEDDKVRVMEAWKRAIRRESPLEVCYRHRRGDGAYRWLNCRAAPYGDDDRMLAGYVGISLDETEQREALARANGAADALRAALLLNEERFKSLVNALPCHVYQVDSQGRVEFVNDHWLEYSGLTAEQARTGRGQMTIHPDDVPELERSRAARAEGEPYETEMRVRRRDGAYRWHLARTVPVKVNGTITGWVGANIDIDDRKRRERVTEFLADAGGVLSETLDLEATLNAITRFAVPRLADWCKIDLVDEQSGLRREAYSNPDPARMAMAAAARDKVGESLKSDPQVEQVILTGISLLVEDVEPLVAEFVAERPEFEGLLDDFGFRSAIVVPIKSRGKRLGALSLVTAESGRRLGKDDLSLAEEFASRFGVAIENALLYEKLTAALQAKDEFLGFVSHELRTPLTTLTGTARTLRRHGDRISAEDRAEALKDLEFGAEWLARIVENMLNLAHADSGAVELEPQLLRRLIGSMIVEQRERLPDHEVALQASETLLPVLANAGYVRQIVGNLLSNARKYSPRGTTIDVTIEKDGDFAAVTVSDRGIGLKQEQLDDVFEPFFRSKEGASRASGIGLGLTVCKRLVELQGGQISASARPGGGTSFRFTLPLAAAVNGGEDD